MRHQTTVLSVIIGIIVLFIAFAVLRAALRAFGQGDCLTGCCMFELGESLMDFGCGSLGCSSLVLLCLVPIGLLRGWFHW